MSDKDEDKPINETNSSRENVDISDQIRNPINLKKLKEMFNTEENEDNETPNLDRRISSLCELPNIYKRDDEKFGGMRRVTSWGEMSNHSQNAIRNSRPPRHSTGSRTSHRISKLSTSSAQDDEHYTEIQDSRNSITSRRVSPTWTLSNGIGNGNRQGNRFQRSISMVSNPEIKLKNNAKNENMVLQLVLPGSVNNNVDNYLTTSSLDEILGSGHFKDRRHLNGSLPTQQDLYSSLGERGSNANGSHINHGFSVDQGEYVRGFSTESMPQTPAPSTDSTAHSLHKSTPPEERNRVFWYRLNTILSGMYALFVVTLGLAVYVTDVIDGSRPIAESYSLYLVVVALAYILFLIIDVSSYNKKVKQFHHSLEKTSENGIQMMATENGNYQLNISLPSVTHARKTLEHHYCLSKDQHAANFYLKLGATVFCFGHLIHSLLLVGYQIIYITADSTTFSECATVPTLILDIIYPIYSFLLLYFIFKYSNIIITRHSILAKYGIMHCLASSICFWIWTIFRETIEALAHSHSSHNDDDDDSTETRMSQVNFLADHPVAYALTNFNKRGARILTTYLNTTLRRFTEACEQDAGMQKIYQSYSPYLYPFSVEYSILVVGVLYIIWKNIGVCEGSSEEPEEYKCKLASDPSSSMESNIVVHADFHSANKGLFGGMIAMLISVVGIILFMIAMSTSEDVSYAVSIHLWNSMTLISIMTVSSIFAYKQISKLDVNHNFHNLLDDMLLIICMPAFFLNGIFTFIPAVINGTATSIAHTILDVLQVLIQTPLMMDGLRRTSNSRDLQKQKPGRELITFLIVCNVASWITNTFEVKSHGLLDDRYEFYGDELWTILGHMCLPLMMFYRFHSSVCLVDIWKYAYEKPHDD